MRISHAVGTQSGCRAGSGTSTLAPSRVIATRSRRSNKVRLSVPLLAAECLAAREDRDCGVAQGQPGDARARITWLTLGNTAVSIFTRGEALSCEQRNGQAHLV